MNMENKISFTGIKNLYIGKKITEVYGTYITPDGLVKQGNKYRTSLKLNCDLFDDCEGCDLSNFRKALDSSDCFQAKCVTGTNTEKIELLLDRSDIYDDIRSVSNSNFKLNGIGIAPNERKVLPLFTYLAALTRKLANTPEVSPEQKKCINLINKSINDEALRFIDNLY